MLRDCSVDSFTTADVITIILLDRNPTALVSVYITSYLDDVKMSVEFTAGVGFIVKTDDYRVRREISTTPHFRFGLLSSCWAFVK